LRVGILTLPYEPWPRLVERWQRIEELGFDSVWTCDHFVFPGDPAGPWFEGVTSLTALAASTQRIRVGALVFCAPFHNPAFLARQLMTIDHLSAGRLEIGLGAGTPDRDLTHRMTGIPDLPAGARVQLLRETVQIVDRLLRERKLTYTGEHHRVDQATLEPGPVQQPRPPLVIAANGPRALRIAAEYADTWTTFVAPHEPLATVRERAHRLNDHLSELGREVQRSVLLMDRPDGAPLTSAAAFEDLAHQYAEIGTDELIVYWPGGQDERRAERDRVIEQVATLRR
jgi:alkanesulfonate monooxygenase SsuD/methylene tetrahydromethanopterin reductase-like flavin-dependent oxidoreductase (luciferase family)